MICTMAARQIQTKCPRAASQRHRRTKMRTDFCGASAIAAIAAMLGSRSVRWLKITRPARKSGLAIHRPYHRASNRDSCAQAPDNGAEASDMLVDFGHRYAESQNTRINVRLTR